MPSTTDVLDFSTNLPYPAVQPSPDTFDSLTTFSLLTLNHRSSAPFVGTGNGLLAEYYTGRNFDTFKFQRTDATVNFDWGAGSPDISIEVNDFTVRWRGKVQAQYSEVYTFYTQSDDGVRLWVNGQEIIDKWLDQPITEHQGTIVLQAGQLYDIQLEYYERGGDAVSKLMWSSQSQAKEIIPQSQLYSCGHPLLVEFVNGLRGDYFNGMNFETLQVSRTDAIVDFNWGTQAPAPSVQADQFSVRWTGYIEPTQSDIYTFYTWTDDGVRLWVNHQLIIDNWTNHPPTEDQGAIALQAGQKYEIKLEYFENAIGAVAQLLWSTPTLPKQVIPNSQLFSRPLPDAGNPALIPLPGEQPVEIGTPLPIYGNKTTIGVNLSGVNDWSTQWPFVDVFKSSRPWISQRQGAGWGQGGELNLTPDGWIASLEPGQHAETVILNNAYFPGGNYTLFYEGEGKLEFAFNNARIIEHTPGKMIVDVTPDGEGVFLRITETNPNNPLRNIRFVMPGFEDTYETQPFHPLFLERIEKFGTLRFMDWGGTNNSNQMHWTDRATPHISTQAGEKGVALEYMIQLANTLKINPWFTIPAKATDDYVRQFATMVRDRLDPSLKAYVEYSNEVWNTMFTQTGYATQQGLERGLDENGFTAAIRFYSERAVEIFKIWEDVFGASMSDRVVRVLAGQAANPWTGEEMMRWKNAYKYTDAYAIAPYFDGFGDSDHDGWSDLNDPDLVDQTMNMTVDQIIDNLLYEIPTEIKRILDSNYNIATRRFGLDLLAYEGGTHLTSYQFSPDKQPTMTKLFIAVNSHERMRDVYREYLRQWQSSGGALFNQFVDVAISSKWGHWGALEYQNQDITSAPKYLGLMDFIDSLA
ncbi:PA14 domain-containing protein [Leptolyngbyaceae cyanobacterium JSC-12]|nr:PA14 domain-containing protein [Leptolyngbyaceae cyanobacterium JSC-12]